MFLRITFFIHSISRRLRRILNCTSTQWIEMKKTFLLSRIDFANKTSSHPFRLEQYSSRNNIKTAGRTSIQTIEFYLNDVNGQKSASRAFYTIPTNAKATRHDNIMQNKQQIWLRCGIAALSGLIKLE